MTRRLSDEEIVVVVSVRLTHGGIDRSEPDVHCLPLDRVRREVLDGEIVQESRKPDREDILRVRLLLEPEELDSLVLPEDELALVDRVRAKSQKEGQSRRVDDGHVLAG